MRRELNVMIWAKTPPNGRSQPVRTSVTNVSYPRSTVGSDSRNYDASAARFLEPLQDRLGESDADWEGNSYPYRIRNRAAVKDFFGEDMFSKSCLRVLFTPPGQHLYGPIGSRPIQLFSVKVTRVIQQTPRVPGVVAANDFETNPCLFLLLSIEPGAKKEFVDAASESDSPMRR